MQMALQHAWCELRRRKARTLVTVLGYCVAISSMIVLVGVLRISGQGSAAILDHTGTHFVAFSPATNTMACDECAPYLTAAGSQQIPAEGLVAFGTRTNLMPHSIVERIRSLSTVAEAAPYLQYRFRNPGDGHLFTIGGFDPANTTVVGTTCCASTDVIKGRFLVRGDRGKILVEVKDSSVQDQAIREVKSLFPGMVISSYACYKPAAKARAISTTTIAILTVAIGVFTILLAMSSQLSVLVERRRELGVLKTIGFSNGRIMGQILLESSVQAALGAALPGLFVLLLMPWVLSRYLATMDVPGSGIRWLPICILAISLSIAGGLLAGLFPALWACRQRPSRLLRSF